jgi:hypothetical protein
MNVHSKIESLQRNLHQFARLIQSLPAGLFTARLDVAWTPRDVTAHLIGWNQATLDALPSIRRGELPDSMVDPGDDFSRINAAFLAQYPSADRQQILRELELSFQALARGLYGVPPAEWAHDFGVRFGEDVITIEGMVDALTIDYADHYRQVETWAAQKTASA